VNLAPVRQSADAGKGEMKVPSAAGLGLSFAPDLFDKYGIG
jgi:hypothetical protein